MKTLKLRMGALAVAMAIGSPVTTASSQTFPDSPVRLIVPSSPGGGADTGARIVAHALPSVFGQRVVVDNRAGASGNIGTAYAAQAAPDGYTWITINNAQAANVSLHSKLPFDLLRDFAPVTLIYSGPHVVVVHPSLPARSIKELVAYAKANPGKLDYASAGTGTVTFLATEIFKDQAGVDITHVPYKGGGDSLRAALAGEAPVYFSPLQVALPHIREGRLVALAVTSKQRMPQLPDVPTVAESGYPDYEFSLWNGLLVPAATPKDRVAKIHDAMVKVLEIPAVRKQLLDTGSIIGGNKPEDFGAFLKAEVETLRRLLTKLKVRVD